MFNCQRCGSTAQTAFRLLTQIRPVHYTHELVPPHNKKGQRIVSQGWEIAQEQHVCEACYLVHRDQPLEREPQPKRVHCLQS